MQRFQYTTLVPHDAVLLLQGLGVTLGVWAPRR